MRLPNGYGSIVKLSGNRRRPYMVRKTIGYDKNNRQIYSILGYHATRDDALIALAHYNQEDVPVVGITLAKVFQAWYPMHSKLVSESTVESSPLVTILSRTKRIVRYYLGLLKNTRHHR